MNAFNKIVTLGLVTAGFACVVYGTCFHSVSVSATTEGVVSLTTSAAKSELTLTQEASVGGVTLDDTTNEIKQTYTGQSPEACAT